MVSPSNSSNAERKNGSPKGRDADDCVTLGIRRRYDLSDDSSEEEEIGDHEGRPTRIKSLTERTFEELGLSDDDDEDEEIYNTHREEMIQYMLDVHRRKQQIVEDYEKKRSVSLSKLTTAWTYVVHCCLHTIATTCNDQ